MRTFITRFPEIQVVAVCDVDQRHRNVNNVEYGWEPARELVERHYAEKQPSGSYRGCAVYHDYRELLEKQKDLEAVMVATPDHTHAVISIAAMKQGKRVYCQKPPTHSVYEARQMAELAREALRGECREGWTL